MPDVTSETGPVTWRNWHAYEAAEQPSVPTAEAVLYSDALIGGHLTAGTGPYQFFNALSRGPIRPFQDGRALPYADAEPAIFLRYWWRSGAPLNMTKTDISAYHGGSSLEEIAALISLSLGIRCRSGGSVRRWDLEDDPLGRPVWFDHYRPYLPEKGSRGPVLPRMTRQVDLPDATPLLAKFRRLGAKAAMEVLRAARMYQEGVWVADDSPNLAWIYLVGAVEIAAKFTIPDQELAAPERMLQELMPELADILLRQGPEHLREVAPHLADLVKSTTRFHDFLLRYVPPPPPDRPSISQVDWEQLSPAFKKIYEYRSSALHRGTPFPTPICECPLNPVGEDTVWLERPLGKAVRVNGTTWANPQRELPMFLATFEYIVRYALQNWWAALPDAVEHPAGKDEA